MDEEVFDVIIVGGGIAGTVAAYELAKAGREVLLVERGNYAGSKNMTGGRIYTHALKSIWPDIERIAPFERKVTHEKISLISADSNFTVDFTSPELGVEGRDSFTVLRAPFDQWLAEQAEEAGAEIVCGIRVDDLIVEDGRVCGVVAGEDKIEARCTILADGVNSLLAQRIGLLSNPTPQQVAVGVKEIIELPAAVIEDRFQCNPDEGASWLFAGDASKGHIGGGFLYTNKESVSFGLVATMADLVTGTTPIYQMFDDFKNHAAIAPLLKGGKTVEYSGHVVPEGGFAMVPKLVGDGVLVTGDAAMLCINLGYMVRGMDFAAASGQMAAQTAIEALGKDDCSAAGLAGYKTRLENSFVLKDLEAFQRFPHFMESCTRMFNEYPQMIRDMMLKMFIVDGQPPVPLKKKMMPELKKVGYGNLFKDVREGMKAL